MKIETKDIVSMPTLSNEEVINDNDIKRLGGLWKMNHDIIEKLALKLIQRKAKKLLNEENNDLRIEIKAIMEFVNEFSSYDEVEEE